MYGKYKNVVTKIRDVIQKVTMRTVLKYIGIVVLVSGLVGLALYHFKPSYVDNKHTGKVSVMKAGGLALATGLVAGCLAYLTQMI